MSEKLRDSWDNKAVVGPAADSGHQGESTNQQQLLWATECLLFPFCPLNFPRISLGSHLNGNIQKGIPGNIIQLNQCDTLKTHHKVYMVLDKSMNSEERLPKFKSLHH